MIRLIENWKKTLDEKFFVGAVLLDLSKAFDGIPHDLLIAKLHAYGFTEKAVTFIHSYLKRRKQNVKIENFYSDFLTLLSGVPQGSILGPILFNLFFNDLLAILKMSELYNFADHHTISTASKNMSNLIQTLEKESETAVEWFNQNKMIVNPDKFQAMLLEKRNENNQSCLKINNQTIKTTNCVKLLGINIDSKLNFDSYILICAKRHPCNYPLGKVTSRGRPEDVLEKRPDVLSTSPYGPICKAKGRICSGKSLRHIQDVNVTIIHEMSFYGFFSICPDSNCISDIVLQKLVENLIRPVLVRL